MTWENLERDIRETFSDVRFEGHATHGGFRVFRPDAKAEAMRDYRAGNAKPVSVQERRIFTQWSGGVSLKSLASAEQISIGQVLAAIKRVRSTTLVGCR